MTGFSRWHTFLEFLPFMTVLAYSHMLGDIWLGWCFGGGNTLFSMVDCRGHDSSISIPHIACLWLMDYPLGICLMDACHLTCLASWCCSWYIAYHVYVSWMLATWHVWHHGVVLGILLIMSRECYTFVQVWWFYPQGVG
jgi:hypothetical protein